MGSLLVSDRAKLARRRCYAVPAKVCVRCGLQQTWTLRHCRVAETLTPAQNATGGFGGGHGHLSHLAPSYAAVLSIAMVGGQEAYEVIDRLAL